MSSPPLLRSTILAFAVAFGVCLGIDVDSARAQDTLGVREAVPLDSLPPLERARQFLIARQFTAALIAAEEAASAMGLEPAADRHPIFDSAAEDTASLHLYRGLSLELQRMFPEARADYDVFLALEADSWRADELRKRYPYVSGQALRSRARVLRDEGAVPETGNERLTVGVFPLYNASSILVMSQVSYGLTGVLYNTLGLLNTFSDQDLRMLPYTDVRLLLDEILPEEVYGTDAAIDAASLARALEVWFLASGRLDEISGSLTGELTIGMSSDLSTTTIEDLQASYTPTGLLDLQRELTMAVADSIQARTGFSYSPSRQAFTDSVETYLFDDVSRLLTYGYALEQLLLGEPVEAQALLIDLNDQVARRDLAQIEAVVAASTPPVDNLQQLTALTPVAAVAVTAPQDTAAVDSFVVSADTTTVAATGPSTAEIRSAHVLSAAAARTLAGFSLWGPTSRATAFDDLQRNDPREGVAGTLDPNRTGPEGSVFTVEVIIPVPSTAKLAPASRK